MDYHYIQITFHKKWFKF